MEQSKKDEILERSRKANEDEGIEFAKKKSEKLYSVVMLIIAFSTLIPIFVLQMPERQDLILAMGAIMFGLVFSETFATYRFAKRKSHLIWAIGMLIMTIFCVVMIQISLWHGWPEWLLEWWAQKPWWS